MNINNNAARTLRPAPAAPRARRRKPAGFSPGASWLCDDLPLSRGLLRSYRAARRGAQHRSVATCSYRDYGSRWAKLRDPGPIPRAILVAAVLEILRLRNDPPMAWSECPEPPDPAIALSSLIDGWNGHNA